ncbi:MAG: hypothetical protein WCY88_16035 [Spongiibacteraceae bacterium]
MFKSARVLVAVATLLSASMVYSQDAATVSFKSDIVPLLKRRCATCHITGNEPGLISLVPKRAYANLVGIDSVGSSMKRVAAGDPEQSYLMHKLLGSQLEVGGVGERMPFMAPALTSDKIDKIYRWIEAGAINN